MVEVLKMLNVSVLMGRLVADPELRYTPNNIAVTSFTLAVNRSYVKSGSERQTDFIDIVAGSIKRSTFDSNLCMGISSNDSSNGSYSIRCCNLTIIS